ncbi:MAG: phosphoribosylpyrophosphate synthetase [Saprospiraceae bacterium]|nr:phosphoribosylpyrophosphate synthetase [Saprospiraceae bacterium]
METYDNLVDAINALKRQGYTENFNLQRDCIDCRDGTLKIAPDDFHIDKYFRFEGDSNPADSSILYAISSEKFGLKGILVNSYGIYSDDIKDELLQKLK